MEGKLKEFSSKQHSAGHVVPRSETPIIGNYYLNVGVAWSGTNHTKKNRPWFLLDISHSLTNLLTPAKITA